MEVEQLISSFMEKENGFPILKFECSDATCEDVVAMVAAQYTDIAYALQGDCLYERFRVKEYLSFFAELHHNKRLLKEAMDAMHLHDIAHVRIIKLNEVQKKRISIARCIIQNPSIFFIQEPLKDVDDVTCRIILQWIDKQSRFQKQVIVTSMSLKQLYLLDGPTYYLNKQELLLLEHEEKTVKDDISLNLQEKISLRSDDKILLFHPSDIDFGESMNGKTYVHVRHDAFIYVGTLDELEAKMKRYGFYRCHRSYLVNMQKVSEIIKWTRNSYSLRMDTMEDVKIPLSKGRIEELKELFNL